MADQTNIGGGGGGRTAPTYQVPSRNIVSVEHPGIVKNVDKAIQTLDGNEGISKILNPPKPDTPANLTLRPEDAMSRPIQSTSMPSSNVLLKITVPKRTGRKRKKGSDGPFTESVPVVPGPLPMERRNAGGLLRRLRDNVGNYRVESVGKVERTHVFRGMPDFVFSTTASSFTNRFREQILSFNYEKMKQFDLDMSKGAVSNVDIIPPPSFGHGDVPFSYIYRQNPTVKQSIDTSGNLTTINTQQAAKILTQMVSFDALTVPAKPSEDCPPFETLDKPLQDTIRILQSLFAERPAWTRRAIRNNLKRTEHLIALRHAIPYVGYIFRAGPWRDAIVRFGHDPRTTQDSRKYQTLMFKILPREPEVARDGGGKRYAFPKSEAGITFDQHRASSPSHDGTDATPGITNTHIFTSHPPLARDGKIWMLCDIADPQLSHILFPPDQANNNNILNSTCDIFTDGWYASGTLAKVRTVMRFKIQSLIEDKEPRPEDFDRILTTLPDRPDPNDTNLVSFGLDPGAATSRDLQLATLVRALVKRSRAMASGVDVGKGTRAKAREKGKGKGKEKERVGRGDSNDGLEKKVQWTDTHRDQGEGEGTIQGQEAVNEDAAAESEEGEEEEIQRAEMLEAQVAAAVAVRERVEAEAEEEDEAEEEEEDDGDGND